MASNKEDNVRKIDKKRKGRDYGLAELLHLKTIMEYWDLFHDNKSLAS